jgi:hypothetical protein
MTTTICEPVDSEMRTLVDPQHTPAMALDDLRLRNTQQLIDDVAARVDLTEGSVTLVLVERPSTRQKVLAVRRLDVSADQPDDYALARRLHQEMQTLPIPSARADARSIVVTVIVRRGFNVWTRVEMTWAMAWRYSNHLTDAFDEDIIVVTEHGWASLLSYAGGRLPCLETGPAG